MADFRTAYSNLIKAVWAAPNLKHEIEHDPSKLKAYGFDTVPQSVKFSAAYSGATAAGFDEQLKSWETNRTGDVSLFIPPQPILSTGATTGAAGGATTGAAGGAAAGAAVKGDACCCCCPCCTCT